jgi:nicotinate-nucleotide pyrophosphorylase (carboxylating)
LNSSAERSPLLQPAPEILALVDRAIQEDLALGDATTEALIPPDLQGTAILLSKSTGILCGCPFALMVFQRIDPTLKTELFLHEGASLEPKQTIAKVYGSIASILMGERTALNILQHLSGIASATALYVQAIHGTPARVIDTRKTLPGLRNLEKYAVRTGGGHNHRRNLGDGVLIKDNHIAAMRSQGMSLAQIIQQARTNTSHTLQIEVEVDSISEAQEALEAGAGLILLDNMSPDQMKQVAELAQGQAILEASGGINLETVRAVAESGVDLISVGALTHSAQALDISLDFVDS